MNVYDYVDEYGIYSFDEKEFNEVDAEFSHLFLMQNFTK